MHAHSTDIKQNKTNSEESPHCYERRAKIYFFIVLIGISVVTMQAYFALTEGSLSLFSDTVHCGGDVINSVGLLIIEFLFCLPLTNLRHKEETIRKVFAYLQIMLLFIGAVYIQIEAIHRFMNPPEIAALLIFKIAVVGLLGNIFAHWLIHRIPSHQHTHNHTLLSLHILFDIAISLIVIVGNICMYYIDDILILLERVSISATHTHIYLIDPVLSEIVVFFMITLCGYLLCMVNNHIEHIH